LFAFTICAVTTVAASGISGLAAGFSQAAAAIEVATHDAKKVAAITNDLMNFPLNKRTRLHN
jgi:hypothetical protein